MTVRSDSCEWWCGRISRWTGFGEESPEVRRTSSPSTVVKDRSWSHDVVHVKDRRRWQSVNRWKLMTTAESLEDSGSTTQSASLWD